MYRFIDWQDPQYRNSTISDNHVCLWAVLYFEDYYIGRHRSRNRRTIPTFPITFWNLHNLLRKQFDHTNNAIEGCHRRPTQVIESDKESNRIQPADKIRSDSGLWTDIRIPTVGIRWDPSVGIRRNISVGFDRPLLLISSFNKLVPGANFRGRSKLPIGSIKFRH
jgi:hypothetical protein